MDLDGDGMHLGGLRGCRRNGEEDAGPPPAGDEEKLALKGLASEEWEKKVPPPPVVWELCLVLLLVLHLWGVEFVEVGGGGGCWITITLNGGLKISSGSRFFA